MDGVQLRDRVEDQAEHGEPEVPAIAAIGTSVRVEISRPTASSPNSDSQT